ncbi:chaperonin GroEL, partial [Candidatus Gracilibacteria bacterium]|nr:chaperonin GroEL [Candidatus Gracilibacteria bacterium]
FEILMEAIKAPFRLIIENSGKNAEAIFETIKFERKMQDSQNIGFDAKRLIICNLIKEGIIDPTKVTITALQKAASVAGMILTTESVICNEEEKEKQFIPQQYENQGYGN